MECKDVMAPIEVPLYADQPASKAIEFMMEKRSGLVPVVDRENRFVGMISGERLMHFMLPKSIGMMRGRKRLGYLHEDHSDLAERLAAIGDRPLSDLLDRDVRAARPETSLMDAVLMLSERQFVVPIVDDAQHLVGAVSFFTVLHALRNPRS